SMDISRREFLAASVAAGVTQAARQPSPTLPAHDDLAYLTMTDAAALLRTRRLSPVELTRAILDRIDRLDSKVGAFITVARDEAMTAARAAEREIATGKYRGPLHGIPVGVKDTHYTKGLRTTANTPVLVDFVPDFDATVVTRLKQVGAVLIGKTKLPEFSFGG